MSHRSILIPIAAVLFVLSSIPLYADDTSVDSGQIPVYSLNEIYHIALEQSEDIKIAQNLLDISQKDVERARSVLAPTISGFGDAIRYNEASVIQPESGWDYGIKLQQQFTVNGKELIIYQAAKDTTRQKEYDLNAVSENYLFKVASAFYDIVNKKNRLQIATANVNRLTAHKKAVLTKLELEEVPKTDLLRTDAELSGAANDLVKAQNELVYARSTMARMLNLSADFDVMTPQSDENEACDGHLDQFIETASQNRTDMKSAQMAVKLAQAMVDISQSDYWPTLAIEAGYKSQGADPSYLAEDDSLYAGARLNMTLLDWGLRKGTIGQEKANKRNAELQLQLKTKEIALQVEKAYLTLITARDAITALKNKLDFSRANFEAVSLQFDLEQADSLDIMDANTLLQNSENEFAEAQYYLALSKIGLQSAQGIFLKTIIGNDHP
jgi:outer membrane protein TolC